MKPRSFRYSSFLPALAVITLSAPSVFAATGTWTGLGDNAWDQSANTEWTGVTGDAWNAANGQNNVAIVTAGVGNFTIANTTTVYANGIHWLAGRTTIGGTAINLAGSNPFLSVVSGQTSQVWANVTGTSGFTKTGLGTVALTAGAKGITGGVTINQGILQLDWDNSGRAGSVGSLDSTNTLTLGGGGLTVKGKSGSGTVTTQTLGNLTLNAGGSTITINPNNTVAGSTTLNLGTWTRNAGATLYVDFSSSNTGTKALTFTTTPSLDAGGIIGGYATINASSTNGDYGFATVSGSNIVRYAYSGGEILTANFASDLASGTNYQVVSAGGNFTTLQLSGPSATQTVHTLDMAVGDLNATTAKTLVINSGGLLFSRTGTGQPVKTGNNLAVTSGTSELVVSVLGTVNSGIGAKIDGGVKDNGGTSVSLIKAGPGTLYMDSGSVNHSYTGDTVVNQGVLQGILTMPSGANKGNLVVNAGGTVSLAVGAGGGTRTINGLSNSSVEGGLVNNSNASGTAATTFLNLGNNNATATFSGVISGISIIKSGAGTQTLSGVNTYAGSTAVNAGKLTIASTGTINGTSAITIGAGEFNYNSATALSQGVSFSSTGGKLSGTGTITPSVTISAGNTLAPGNSIGILTFGTNLTLAGTYSVELGTVNANPALSLSDRTVVTGTLGLGGNLTLVDNAGANGNGSAAPGAYRIATSTGATSGSFATFTNPLSATLHEGVVYGTNTTDLNLYRLATGSTAAVALGKARVGGTLTGSLTTTNSATADGFSEKLNASVGSNAGDVNASSGTVSGVIAGANASTISVGLDTATRGAKSGSVLVSYVSDGTGLNNYTTTANGSQTVGVTGDVYELASANFAQTSGVAISGAGPTYTLNFGTGLSLNTLYSASFSIQNGVVVDSYIDTLTGDYGLTGAAEFGTSAVDFSALAAGAAANAFNITFYTTSAGTYLGTFSFDGTSVQSGLANVSVGDFSIALSANAVPEPNAAALLGGLGTLLLLRRRRTT